MQYTKVDYPFFAEELEEYNKTFSLKEKVDNIKQAVGNKIFTVKFFKLNGKLRTMTCRLNVQKHCGNNVPTVDINKYLVVFEMDKLQYRNVSVDKIVWLKFRNQKWYFSGWSSWV